jgi:hypothetical protein
MEQVARLPTRKELWRAALMVMVGDAAITIVSAPLEGGFLAVGFDMPLGVIDEEAAAILRGSTDQSTVLYRWGCASLEGRS